MYYILLQVGNKIGQYNTVKAKAWKVQMDNLVGVRGIKLTNLLAFKKLLEVGQKKEMKLDSGKVSTKKFKKTI